MHAARKKLASEIRFQEFVQFEFDRQWTAFKRNANRRGIGEKNREEQRERLLKEKASDARADCIERKKVMALARAREIDAILVTELSRLGPSTIDPVQTLQARDVSVLAISGLQFDGGARRVRARFYPRAHQVRHRRRQGPR